MNYHTGENWVTVDSAPHPKSVPLMDVLGQRLQTRRIIRCGRGVTQFPDLREYSVRQFVRGRLRLLLRQSGITLDLSTLNAEEPAPDSAPAEAETETVTQEAAA